MTWAEISAELAETSAEVFGEPCTLIAGATGAETACTAVVVRVPGEIAPGGAWEYRPTAAIPVAQLGTAPAQGDALVDADGRRWRVDACDELEGMYQLTLRADS